MKKLFIFYILYIFISCKNDVVKSEGIAKVATLEKGEALFQKNNCASCHQPDQKVVGPSMQEIAKIYKEKNGNMVAFLKEEAEPIVDPKMYESMKINLQITKTMTDEELQSLEMYFLSHSK